jgi:hypothetical protein
LTNARATGFDEHDVAAGEIWQLPHRAHQSPSLVCMVLSDFMFMLYASESCARDLHAASNVAYQGIGA